MTFEDIVKQIARNEIESMIEHTIEIMREVPEEYDTFNSVRKILEYSIVDNEEIMQDNIQYLVEMVLKTIKNAKIDVTEAKFDKAGFNGCQYKILI